MTCLGNRRCRDSE